MKTLKETIFYIACCQVFMSDDVVFGMKILACEIYGIEQDKLETMVNNKFQSNNLRICKNK